MDDALRARLGAAAARRAAGVFDEPVVFDRLERLYRDVLSGYENRGSSGDAHRD
jgi:hypothetical protein